MSYKVIDNFLEEEIFKKFKKQIFDSTITPWFYRTNLTFESLSNNYKEDLGYFTLCFFNNFKQDYMGLDEYLYKIYEKLNCKAIIQSRANLFLKNKNKQKLFFHKDYEYKDSFTAILYMNTNNGGTVMKIKDKEIKINSIENRAVIFNTKTLHASEIQTDEKLRIIININFF